MLHVSFSKSTYKSLTRRKKKDAFLCTAFCNWKKALISLRDHQQSKCHLAALTFEVTVPQCGNILEMTSEDHKVKVKENRQ